MKKKLTTKKRLFAPCSHCADECANQPIQVLIVKPHLRPYGATICPSLRSMQDIVFFLPGLIIGMWLGMGVKETRRKTK